MNWAALFDMVNCFSLHHQLGVHLDQFLKWQASLIWLEIQCLANKRFLYVRLRIALECCWNALCRVISSFQSFSLDFELPSESNRFPVWQKLLLFVCDIIVNRLLLRVGHK